VGDHYLAEVAAAFEMAVRLSRLLKRECPVANGVQFMCGDRPVHRLKIGTASYAAAF
jgi:hypothetical protein